MPVHNGAAFLRPAIESVLAQTYRDLELLIIDDDSSDESVAIAQSFADSRIRLLAGHGRRGLSGTLNMGLREASGEFVARLDQDDLSYRDRIEEQVARLDRRRDVVLVGSLAQLIDENGRPSGMVHRPTSQLAVRWYSFVENAFIHSSVMFRRGVVLELGGYDESLPFSEDYDLWSRVLRSHAAENIPRNLIAYRRASSSVMTILESEGGGPRQQQLRATMARLIERRVEDELGGATADEAALLAHFTFGVDHARLPAFLELLTRLRRRFESKWREAVRDTDYWRTLAWQYDAIAFRARPATRRDAVRIYLDAWVTAPRAARQLSWKRAIALTLLGKRGRQWAAGLSAKVS